MNRFALHLAYDGSGFAGCWRARGRRTVAAVCDLVCGRLGLEVGSATFAARTDAGVHAEGQVVAVDGPRDIKPARLAADFDAALPEDCSCRAAAAVASDWDVRGSAWKTYRYVLDPAVRPHPDLVGRAWRPPRRTDPARLADGAFLLRGAHDFSAFRRRGDHRDDHRCRLESVEWTVGGTRAVCRIRGDRFTYRLVRSLVGAMVALAGDQIDRAELIAARDGEPTPAIRHQAPAHGLCLEEVRYAAEPGWVAPDGGMGGG